MISLGEDNNQYSMLSDDKYLNIIVSFWEINPEDKERKLLCLGASIELNWIFVDEKCHGYLEESNNTVICTGSSYFDDIYMNFIIEGLLELKKCSHFIILVVSSSR